MSNLQKFSAWLVALLPVAAFAAIPADVTTAITAAGTDAGTMGAAILVVLIGIVAFKYLRKTF